MDSDNPKDKGGGRKPPSNISWTDRGSETVRDSGYRTESPSPFLTTNFFLGNGSNQTQDTAAGGDDPIFAMDDIVDLQESSNEEQFDRLQHSPDDSQGSCFQYQSCFTPPRGYHYEARDFPQEAVPMMSQLSVESDDGQLSAQSRHVSTQVPASSARAAMIGSAYKHQQKEIQKAQERVAPRRRFYSEATFDEDSEEEIITRHRSLSAPVILTPAQRHCASELRRISDDFDKEYHGFGSLYRGKARADSSTLIHSSSFPKTEHSASWWQSVVQYVAPKKKLRRKPSPIRESVEREESSDH